MTWRSKSGSDGRGVTVFIALLSVLTATPSSRAAAAAPDAHAAIAVCAHGVCQSVLPAVDASAGLTLLDAEGWPTKPRFTWLDDRGSALDAPAKACGAGAWCLDAAPPGPIRYCFPKTPPAPGGIACRVAAQAPGSSPAGLPQLGQLHLLGMKPMTSTVPQLDVPESVTQAEFAKLVEVEARTPPLDGVSTTGLRIADLQTSDLAALRAFTEPKTLEPDSTIMIVDPGGVGGVDDGSDEEGGAGTDPGTASHEGDTGTAQGDMPADWAAHSATTAIGRAPVAPVRSAVRSASMDGVVLVGDARGFRCTGVLVSPDHVLTARHCLPLDRVGVGWTIAKVTTIRVTATHAAPSGLDAALAVLERPAAVEVMQRRGSQDAEPPTGSVRLVGFGVVDALKLTGFGTRRWVDVPADGWGCDVERARALGCAPGRELVLADRAGSDTCYGDSGGPVLEPAAGGWRLVAITSRPTRYSTRECGAGGIYVRVDVLAAWLDEMLAHPGHDTREEP